MRPLHALAESLVPWRCAEHHRAGDALRGARGWLILPVADPRVVGGRKRISHQQRVLAIEDREPAEWLRLIREDGREDLLSRHRMKLAEADGSAGRLRCIR